MTLIRLPFSLTTLPTLCLLPLVAQAQDVATPSTAPETIVVQGKRAPVTRRIDRKIYRADTDLQSSSGTAGDVLNTVPSVDVDVDGKVSLRGDSGVTILINGKPSSQVSGATGGDGLGQIPASEIDRIEVITNPSAEFKADGQAGIINIILKNTRKPGTSGSAQVNIGNDGRYNLGAAIAHNMGRLNLSGTMAFRQDEKLRHVTDARSALDPQTGQWGDSRHDLVEHVHRQMRSLGGGIGYDLTPNDTLSARLDWAERSGPRDFLQRDETSNGASDSLRDSQGKEWRLDLAQDLSYERRLANEGETLSVNLQRTIVRERENYHYLNTSVQPAAPDTRDTLHLGLDLVNTDFSIDYVRPLSGDRLLKTGYDFQRDDNGYDNSGTLLNADTGQYETNPDVTNSFRYYQAIHAAYATYQMPVGHLDMLAGLRLEDVRVRTHQITGAMTGESGYFRAYPSLHLSYGLSEKMKLFTSYSQRVERPDPEDLNPFADHQDTHNLRAGNPDLKPTETQSFEGGYSYDNKGTSYSATAYWRNTHNAVSDVSQVISDDVVLVTKTNIPRSRAGGLEFTASGKLLPKLSYNASGNIFYNEIDTTAFGGAGTSSNIAANAKASLDFRPVTADVWQISTNYTGKRLTTQGYILPITTVNMGFRHQIRNNMALVVTVSDAFNGQKFQRVIDTSTLHDRYTRLQAGRVIFVGLSFTGSAAKKSKTTFEYE